MAGSKGRRRLQWSRVHGAIAGIRRSRRSFDGSVASEVSTLARFLSVGFLAAADAADAGVADAGCLAISRHLVSGSVAFARLCPVGFRVSVAFGVRGRRAVLFSSARVAIPALRVAGDRVIGSRATIVRMVSKFVATRGIRRKIVATAANSSVSAIPGHVGSLVILFPGLASRGHVTIKPSIKRTLALLPLLTVLDLPLLSLLSVSLLASVLLVRLLVMLILAR